MSGGDLVNDVQPTGVSGRFTALFLNTGSSVADNGFYTVDLVLGAGSAAQAGQYTYQGVPFDESASSELRGSGPDPGGASAAAGRAGVPRLHRPAARARLIGALSTALLRTRRERRVLAVPGPRVTRRSGRCAAKGLLPRGGQRR